MRGRSSISCRMRLARSGIVRSGFESRCTDGRMPAIATASTHCWRASASMIGCLMLGVVADMMEGRGKVVFELQAYWEGEEEAAMMVIMM